MNQKNQNPQFPSGGNNISLKELDLFRSTKTLETQKKIMGLGLAKDRIESKLGQLMLSKNEAYCDELLKSDKSSKRLIGLMAITRSSLLPSKLFKIINMFYYEKDEEIRSSIILSMVDYFDYLEEHRNLLTPKQKNKVYKKIRKLFKYALKDESEVVRDSVLYAIGMTDDKNSINFINRLKKEMWMNPNPFIRGTAANSLYAVIHATLSSNFNDEKVYYEFKRLYLEDAEVRPYLINILNQMAVETELPEIRKEVLMILDSMRSQYWNSLNIMNFFDMLLDKDINDPETFKEAYDEVKNIYQTIQNLSELIMCLKAMDKEC